MLLYIKLQCAKKVKNVGQQRVNLTVKLPQVPVKFRGKMCI